MHRLAADAFAPVAWSLHPWSLPCPFFVKTKTHSPGAISNTCTYKVDIIDYVKIYTVFNANNNEDSTLVFYKNFNHSDILLATCLSLYNYSVMP